MYLVVTKNAQISHFAWNDTSGEVPTELTPSQLKTLSFAGTVAASLPSLRS